MNSSRPESPLGSLARVFLRLGLTGFGGPAAHVAMIEEEVVLRRGWVRREQLLDLISAANLIPGPNSTELAMHVGFARAGLSGLVVAGLCFILPAVTITAGLAWLYLHYGTLPRVAEFVFGIRPALLAVIATTVLRLARGAVKSARLGLVALGVIVASLLGVNEVLALLLGGGLGALLLAAPGEGAPQRSVACAPWPGLGALVPVVGAAAAATLPALGLFFLKVGSVLYGSGYVLIAFLQGGLVHDRGWLTQQQLLDAVAIGQFTPGPVLSTATFIGYLIAGAPGALVATVGIFLPSFVLVAVSSPLVPRLRRWRWTGRVLDAVNASSVGLMAAVTVKLAGQSLGDWRAWLIAGLAGLVGWRWRRLSPGWLVAGGSVLGWALSR